MEFEDVLEYNDEDKTWRISDCIIARVVSLLNYRYQVELVKADGTVQSSFLTYELGGHDFYKTLENFVNEYRDDL